MNNNEENFFVCGKKRRNTRKQRAYKVWIEKLLQIASSIFDYQNLPPNLPRWEIEKRLIMAGSCTVFQNEIYGVITSFGGLSGVDIYNNANSYNYAQAVLGSKSGLQNMINCVIMYGTSVDKLYGAKGVIGRRIQYYADMLSDIDVSRQVALINNRSISSVIAKSDNALTELKIYYDLLEAGELTVPRISSGVLDATEPLNKGANNQLGYALSDYDTASQNILKQFYHDFGVAFSNEKRERLLTEEIATENAALQINVNDMLKCRQDGAAAINNLFGTAIVVTMSGGVAEIET